MPLRAPGIRAAMPIASSRFLASDQEVAAELFARLRERTVRHQPLAVAHLDAGRRRNRLQGCAAKYCPSFLSVCASWVDSP